MSAPRVLASARRGGRPRCRLPGRRRGDQQPGQPASAL